MNCQRCGALVDPTALECPYCQFTTPLGAQTLAQQEQAARARAGVAEVWAYQQQRVAQMQVTSLGRQALWWSLAGMVLCCLPLGVVSIVQGLRSRARAAALRMAVPGTAIAGLVLGSITCILSIGAVTYAFVDASQSQDQANARIAALDKQIGTRAEDATLDHGVACALAEQFTLKNGFEGTSGFTYDKFECPGKVTQSVDAAELEDFKFHYNDDEKKTSVCFKRGARWYVDKLAPSGCDSSAAAASASQAGSTSPSASAATATSASAAASDHPMSPSRKPARSR